MRLFQLRAGIGNLRLIRRTGRGVFETEQIHRRAGQLQFQPLAVQCDVQLRRAVLVGREAGGFFMLMVMMVFMCVAVT